MTRTRILYAGAILLATVATAEARPGVANTTVNLRSNPTTASPVLAKIPGGAPVDIGPCNDGWCAVSYGGMSGFTIATALNMGGPPTAYVPVSPGYVPVVPVPGYYVAPRPYYYGYRRYWGPYGYRRW